MIVDNQKKFGTLLTNLSKAFDCLSHDLLVTILNASGFTINSLRLKQDYLTNCKQRTRKNSAYSSWEEIFFGVPQGSVSGSLIFNNFFTWFIFHYGGHWFCNLCRWKHTIHYTKRYGRCYVQVAKFIKNTFSKLCG